MKSKPYDPKVLTKNILVIYKNDGCDAGDIVASLIKKKGFEYIHLTRDQVTRNDLNSASLVIIVGGDGTALRVTNKIRNNSLVLTVNSHPDTTEGYLCRATTDNFSKRFNQILKGDFTVRKLPRLHAVINGKAVSDGLALNEVSISPQCPYQTMRYNHKNRIEKASGVIVSTPIGSTGWCKSAGGKVMPISSKKMQFVVREPYYGRIYRVNEKSGIVDSFRMKAMSEGIIVFDAIHTEYHFARDDIIEVKKSDNTLNFIEF